MNKTKTIKTPLLMAEAYGSTSCTSSLLPESTLSHRPAVQYGLVPKLSHQGGKTLKTEERDNQVATLKIIKKLISKIIKMFFSEAKRNGVFAFSEHRMHLGIAQAYLALPSVFSVFPLVMSLVAKQRGMMAEAVTGARSQSQAMTAARRLEELRHQQRGFSGFC